MQNLENNLQHWMYFLELGILLTIIVFQIGNHPCPSTITLFIAYFGAMMWIGVNVIRVWLRQRERDERSSRYRTVVAEAAVAEMVETVEQDKAFEADDSKDLPKVVESCDGQRRKEENLEAAVET
jgi:hypothetical protein